MPVFFSYILKGSVSLAVVFLFYQLILRKLTFYNLNRWYLFIYTIVCFFIPLIDISPLLYRNQWTETTIVRWIPSLDTAIKETDSDTFTGFFTTWNIAGALLLFGIAFLSLRLLMQFLSFRKMLGKATLLSGEELKIYQVNDSIIPFSFGKSVFINRDLHTPEELQEIIRHEFVHVKQNHSLDIIWGELLCIINWYNPFAWLLKKSIRQNLEFIADNQVIQHGIDKKEYQYLLLKVIGNNQFSIAASFNFSSLKKRIAMMNKTKSARRQILRMLFLLPATAILILAFRTQVETFKKTTEPEHYYQSFQSEKAGVKDTVPEQTKPNAKGYYIDIKDNSGSCMVVVKDKNRKEIKRLLLTDWNEKAEHYENLYGEIPPPPPPSPSTISPIGVEGKPLAPAKAAKPPKPAKAPTAITIEGKPLATTVAPVIDIKEVTVAGQPVTTTINAPVEIMIVGKPITSTATTAIETTVMGKPIASTIVTPVELEISVAGKPIKATVVSEVNTKTTLEKKEETNKIQIAKPGEPVKNKNH